MEKKSKKTGLKKISLSIWERIMLPQIFPSQSTFVGRIVINDVRKKVSFTQDEIKKFELKSEENGFISWSKEIARKTFEYSFTDLEHEEIRLAIEAQLTALDKEQRVTDEWIPFAEKFGAKPKLENEKTN